MMMTSLEPDNVVFGNYFEDDYWFPEVPDGPTDQDDKDDPIST